MARPQAPAQYQPVEAHLQRRPSGCRAEHAQRWYSVAGIEAPCCRAGEQCQSTTSASAATMRSGLTLDQPASIVRTTPASSQIPAYPQMKQASVRQAAKLRLRRSRPISRRRQRRRHREASTTLRSISGLTPPRTGSIKLAGEEISLLPPQEIVGLGICQSPEGRKCFQRMTVRENLELGAYLRRDSSGIASDLDRDLRALPAPRPAPSRRRRARCPAASSRCSPSAAR